MKILITGGCGTIARNLTRLLSPTNEVISLFKHDLNLLDIDNIKTVIDKVTPDIIIHTAINGGNRTTLDNWNIIEYNVQMYENLVSCTSDKTKIITFGSGAEFDRRKNIDCVMEYEGLNNFPLDPYGISKSIITQRALQQNPRSTCVLRLFGCFSHDDKESRFINNSILKIKSNLPIEIHQNRLMDFFYIDDIFNVINHFIHNTFDSHINLVYYNKYSLLDIVNILLKTINKQNHPIIINDTTMGLSYTGNSTRLDSLNINLIGLERGIEEVCKKLL